MQVQPWIDTAFTACGELRPASMHRLRRVLDRFDELGMVAIIGLYYFGQDERLIDEEALRNRVRKAIAWITGNGYTKVIIEIDNECGIGRYDQHRAQARLVQAGAGDHRRNRLKPGQPADIKAFPSPRASAWRHGCESACWGDQRR